MIKRAAILLLCILTCCCAHAQTPLVFVGKLSVKDVGDYTYELQFTDTNGVISGFSVTDITGAEETKTAITGTIDKDKGVIDYHETKLISTKSKGDKADFVYIHGHLKITEPHGITMLKGQFTGYGADGKTVKATGKLTLASAKDVMDKIAKLQPKDTAAAKNTPTAIAPKSEAKEVVYEEEKAIPDREIIKVTPDNSLSFACASSIIMLEVWDAKTIDGDIITLLQDGTPILQNYTLTGHHKQITLNMGDKPQSTLTLIAISEGSEPLNTARIKITSASEEHYVDATTTIGKNVVIELKRK